MITGENYKGIDFVRISSLPEEQRLKINVTFSIYKIIKILRDKELLKDCIQYVDYQDWYTKTYSASERIVWKPIDKRAIYFPNSKSRRVLR